MHAHLIDKNLVPITDDQSIDNDSDLVNMINLARDQDVTCAIKWHRPSDGQIGYWSPNGACLQPHWYNGNHNAKKYDETSTSYIHARCTPSDKARWVKSAQDEGLKLTEWIIKILNSTPQNGAE